MFRRTRIIGIVGVALVLVPSAFAQQGERFQEAPQWHQALQARSEGMNERYLPTKSSPVIVGERFQAAPQWHQALSARSEALNKQHGLGAYAVSSIDARERSLTAKSEAQLAAATYPDWFERAAATAIRDGRGVYVADDRFDFNPNEVPTTVTATSSGRDIDVPQVGVGLGIGLLLVLGLYLAMRFTRIRPVAH